MKEVPFTNAKNHAVHVAGKTIPPGQTRMVELSRVPLNMRDALHVSGAAAPAPAQAEDSVLKLLDLSVPKLREAIADRQSVSGEDLDTLETTERAGKTRTTALEAIQEERLDRAAGGNDNSGSNDGDAFEVPENLGELLDGEEAVVLENIAKLKAAMEAETEPAIITDEALDALLDAENNGAKREAVSLAIMELEANDQGSGSES